jgi:hypothetical protein
MSAAHDTYTATATENIPQEVRSVLGRLRRRIRVYVFLEGLAWVLIAAAAVFWVTLGMNWAYFKLSRLELPQWFRVVLDIAAVLLVVGCFLLVLMRRLLTHMRTKALALVLERRFPGLDDRLITAVESGEALTGHETPLTRAMLARTVETVRREAGKLPVGEVFRGRPLGTAATLAVLLVASIVTFGLLNTQALGYWYQAFIGLQDEYWDRDTKLVARAVGESGKSFREFNDEQVVKHPRGADFTLSVIVPEEDEKTGKKWVVPENVTWEYDMAGGRGGGEVVMNRVRDSEREFRQTVTGLLDDMTFTITGGDYVNRYPYRVLVVDPPVIDQVELDRRFPEYTGLNPAGPPADAAERRQRAQDRIVQGTSVALPMETRLTMTGQANKPLSALRIETELFHLSVRGAKRDADGRIVTPGTARLRVISPDGVPFINLPLSEDFAASVLTNGADSFRLPLELSTTALLSYAPPVPVPADGPLDRLSAAHIGAGLAAWLGKPLERVPLTASTLLRIYLEDTDGIVSREPSRLTINGILDKSPEIETQFVGIGEFITPEARIPIAGTIQDDYGVKAARFEYRVTSEKGLPVSGEAWQIREFTSEPAGQKLLTLKTDEEPFERFEVAKILLPDQPEPRGNKVGEVLHLSVYAEDGDDINGPHGSRGRPTPEYVFKVVSREELLTILYQKELGLLARFRQVIDEVAGVKPEEPQGVLREIIQAAQTADELARMAQGGQTGDDYRQKRAELTSTAKRSIQKSS